MQWRARKAFIFYVFFLFIVYVHILWLMLCTWQCLNMYLWFALSLVLLCPCWILYPWCIYLSVFVSVEYWTCKWYFTLSLLACMSECSFLVWMIIVITIYSDCSCLVKPCFIVIFLIAWSHCACSICISRFLLTMIILCYCFQEKLVRMVQELHSF